MFIWLQGPSGAGKSTTGRILSSLRGVGFADIDELVERNAGRSVTEIFADGGEAEFRRLERQTIRAFVEEATGHYVVALGAGALEDPETRRLIASTGLRFFLDLTVDEAIARLENGERRPLLERADRHAAWSDLYRRRIELYSDADHRVDTSNRDPADVAAELSRAEDRLLEPLWSREWRLVGDPTTVSIYQSIFALMLALRDLAPSGETALISDDNVAALYREHLNPAGQPKSLLCTIEPGENGKRLAGIETIAVALAREGISRDGSIVGLGGGVVTDLAGFTASIYMRGIDSIAVPTTLLAQVDAAIGGKTAVKAAGIRNLFGSYKQPRHVLISPGFLRTLPQRELRSGMVEALKIGIIHEPRLVTEVASALEAISRGRVPERIVEIIRLAVETKFRIVEQDVHDGSVRLSLNFGHTFAHAIEAAEPGRYTHGEAVAIGMIAATELASDRGAIGDARRKQLISSVVPLAPACDAPHDLDAILGAMRGDKKRTEGALRFILPGEESGFAIERVDDSTAIIGALERAFSVISHYKELQK
jgi:3-dehydroquinate synthase